MSQIDSTTVDVDDIINRIQAVRRGELPEDSVSIEELRAAVTAQRQRFSTSAVKPVSETTPAGTPRSKKSTPLVVPKLDLF